MAAVNAIRTHLGRGNLSDGLAFDAVRVRLIEIGEAVKTLSADSLASEAVIPWDEIAQRRDRLAHGYFDTSHAIVAATVEHDVRELVAAIRRLLDMTRTATEGDGCLSACHYIVRDLVAETRGESGHAITIGASFRTSRLASWVAGSSWWSGGDSNP